MLGRMLSAVILIGTGMILVSANGDITQNTRNIDPAMLVGIGSPLCLKSPGNAADNTCAMCYWGEALVLGPNINMPMSPEAVAPAVATSNKAIKLTKRSTPREQALIKALAVRYLSDPNAGIIAANMDAFAPICRTTRLNILLSTQGSLQCQK